jgi:AcrR family transcriptional regulator
MTCTTAGARPGSRPPGPAGLRKRKKDATRRALAEAALDLASTQGYDSVTIAAITERVGVSRRTFSNYFSGKAECISAVSEGWLDDIIEAIRHAPDDQSLEVILCDSLGHVAAGLPQRWERMALLFDAEPELQSMVGAIDAVNVEQLTDAIGDRVGLPADDIRVRMLATYGIAAGRIVLEQWLLRGKPDGEQGFDAQLSLAFSIINLNELSALHGRRPLPTDSNA